LASYKPTQGQFSLKEEKASLTFNIYKIYLLPMDSDATPKRINATPKGIKYFFLKSL
jgi:hypothetical protein